VAHQRGEELSAGFATALDLGLALLSKPRLVLLDEPLTDLDGASRDRAVDVLDAYRTGELAPGAAGDVDADTNGDADPPERTVVVATHNVGAFEDAATRVTLLADGEVVLDAPYEDLRAELVGPEGAAGAATGTNGTLQSRYERLVADHWEYGED
jgi:ABC-type multidrug transport system ATPase subunit